VAVALLAGFVPLGQSGTDTPKEKNDLIAALITQLGGPKYKARQAAQRSLLEIGTPALDALRQASRGKDAEVRSRALDLIKLIEKRDETAKILAPTKVRLRYKDTPLATALADLRKKTGLTIHVPLTPEKLRGRKITLATGEVTLWEAVDRFCQEAGLVDQNLLPGSRKINPRTDTDEERERLIYLQRLRRAQLRQGGIYEGDLELAGGAPRQLVLVEGKSPVLSTVYLGAVRIQVIPANLATYGLRKKPGEPAVALVVRYEPKVQWYTLVHLGIGGARDENGQEVKAKKPLDDLPSPFDDNPYGDVRIIASSSANWSSATRSPVQGIPVCFQAGDGSAKVIKELRGKIEARVQGLPRELMAIDNILKAEGKSAKDENGMTWKVAEVKENADSSVTIGVEVEGDRNAGRVILRGGRVRRVIGGRVQFARSRTVPGLDQLALLDDKGRPFVRTNTGLRRADVNGRLLTMGWDITFQPDRSQGRPARLVLKDARPTIVTLPFTLKDIKLPR
jgi:hypothetical protein